MTWKCTEKDFLENVKDHKIHVLQDDGLRRHIRYQRDGSWCYGFDLLTWPGHLCITGDCGSYLFARIEDMFGFFRDGKDKLRINPHYWAEKCLAHKGIEEFDADKFRENVKEWFKNVEESDDFEDDEEDEEKTNRKEEIREAVEELLQLDNEFECYQAIRDFDYDLIDFSDFWECNCKDYTYQYIWCLYAIVWGINQYDEYKKMTPSK